MIMTRYIRADRESAQIHLGITDIDTQTQDPWQYSFYHKY